MINTTVMEAVEMNNVTIDHFPVNPKWALEGIFWLPSVVLGLPANLFVVLLGNHTSGLGNFCFAINIISIINVLHCCSRGIVIVFYYYHYIFSIETSLISATIVTNAVLRWSGYYIVFYIPSLSAYRVVLLCVRGGEHYLSKRNLSIVTVLVAVVPTATVISLLVTLAETEIVDADPISSFHYSDSECLWCAYISTYSPYISYLLTFVFTLMLCIHVYRSFGKVFGTDRAANLPQRRLREEIGILACVIVHSLIPVLLTIPLMTKGVFLMLGFERSGSALANILYNYNPLFDAILIIVCIKPYRTAFTRKILLCGKTENWADRTVAIQSVAMRPQLNLNRRNRKNGESVL